VEGKEIYSNLTTRRTKGEQEVELIKKRESLLFLLRERDKYLGQVGEMEVQIGAIRKLIEMLDQAIKQAEDDVDSEGFRMAAIEKAIEEFQFDVPLLPPDTSIVDSPVEPWKWEGTE